MNILSFDIGIKNLCFCELDKDGKILDWSIVNISNDVPCEHEMKMVKRVVNLEHLFINVNWIIPKCIYVQRHSKNKKYEKLKNLRILKK